MHIVKKMDLGRTQLQKMTREVRVVQDHIRRQEPITSTDVDTLTPPSLAHPRTGHLVHGDIPWWLTLGKPRIGMVLTLIPYQENEFGTQYAKVSS